MTPLLPVSCVPRPRVSSSPEAVCVETLPPAVRSPDTGRARARFLPAALLALALTGGALAHEAPPAADDPVTERHMMELAKELRCLVCQNQTIADSQAELAADLRQQVRELIRKGMSDEEIKAYLVARYGDFVLYRPPVNGNTLLLWFGPAVLLAGGMVALVIALRRRIARIDAAEKSQPLSDDEARRAHRLLEQDAEEGSLS